MSQQTFLRIARSASRFSYQSIAPRTTSSFITPSIRPSLVTPVSAGQRISALRSYSEEAAKKKDDAPAEETSASTENKAEEALKKELEAKKAEVADMTDRMMRTVADYRNLQEQTKREVQAAKDFALQRFAKDLLDSIDNLDRALTTVPAEALTGDAANKDLVSLHSGLKMTETILLQTLQKHGLERFDPAEKGDKFDPNRMEATFQAPQAGKEDGSVFYTQSKGFSLKGRVLRAAKVGVVRNA